MRAPRAVHAGALLAVGIAAVPTLAASTEDHWYRVSAQDGVFSAETPCSAEQVSALSQRPEEVIPGVKFSLGKTIVCGTNDFTFVVGELEASEREVGASNAFDLIVSNAAGVQDIEGTPSTTTLKGHRASVNRQQEGGMLAQSGAIEIGRTKILLYVAGGRPDGSLSIAEQAAAIDRFFQSIEVIDR